MTRRLIWAFLALLVAAGFTWALWPRPIAVETATVGLQDIEVVVREEGEAHIREVFTVSAPISGHMSRQNLHAGDEVAAGETVVAQISPAVPALLDLRTRRIAEATRDAAEAAVGLARAEFSRAQAQEEYARSELQRVEALVNRDALPRRSLDQARLDAAAAKAAVESARANLLVRERELESARAALIEGSGERGNGGCCVDIVAPASGQILRVLTESEQVVSAATPLLEIGDPADLEIEVELLSSDAVRVKVGALATIDGWGGPPLAARVTRIDPSATTRVSALGIEEQRVKTVLAPEGERGAWRELGDGYRVTAHIVVWQGKGLPAIPVGALFRSGDAWAVFRVDAGQARLVQVELGQRNEDWAELRGGLEPGADVILYPGDRIAEGGRVTEAR
ncbi:HlyD family efflux transporter periplasmic adaptor subunit [uncultured Paracoccus sp.]|uniref:efflux RND transporter periplasmic adaptor subunit n=1 Tax=uncultured Paracoccus sp. TaxID=189685 RepID=UPI002616A9DB|nr:HlyD family efflux transporter periplasmic adaptor subunit [uncultured Paracoccus sp.]